ncbi:MAG: DUF721 domain-containing protein [Nitrospira sp.]|nr:DUF721 domain-containing protein [Nitrospira sp.]
MARPGTLDSFGTILSGLSKRLGLESRLVELRLQHQWRNLVGEPMASHTWPAHIRFKKLYLIVRNSVWLQQLTFLKPALLTKLQAEAGQELVTDIVGRVGELPSDLEAPPPVDLNPDTQALQSEGSWAEVVTHTTTIQDPALRDRFREVISRYPAQVPPQPARDPSRAP